MKKNDKVTNEKLDSLGDHTAPKSEIVVDLQSAEAVNKLNEFRYGMLKGMSDLASTNYQEDTRIAGVLDDKAQKTGGIAGAFLAAGLAFLKPDTNLSDIGGVLGLSILALNTLLLLICIALCLRVMWVRGSEAPPSFFDLVGVVDNIFKLAEKGLTNELKENLIWDECSVWRQALLEQIKVNNSKAKLLRGAQACLALAMLTIGLVLFLTMAKILWAPHFLKI